MSRAGDLANRYHSEYDFLIWDDGTQYHGDALGPGTDKGESDFGRLFNDLVSQIPSGTPGRISIKRSPRGPYIYNTTPVIDRNYITVEGAQWGVQLQPGANVTGLTIRAPAGDSLLAPRIRRLGFIDPNNFTTPLPYILLDNQTNGGGIGWGLFDELLYFGNNQGSGKTGKFIQINADSASHATFDCVFNRIFGGSNFMAGLNGNHFLNGTDSILDIPNGAVFDCIFQDWFVAWHAYTGTNPWVNNSAAGAQATGNLWYNIKLLADTTPSNVVCFLLNNQPNQYLEDLFLEIGTKPASGSVGLQISGAGDEIRIRRFRCAFTNTGVQWTANATSITRQYFWGLDIFGCDISLQSISGDASRKTFISGLLASTTNLSPNPLTGASFYKTYQGSSGGVAVQGFNVTTPAYPASTVAVTNTTGYDCMVYLSGGTFTAAVQVDGVSTGLPAATTNIGVLVPAGSTITLTFSAAGTWKWYAI